MEIWRMEEWKQDEIEIESHMQDERSARRPNRRHSIASSAKNATAKMTTIAATTAGRSLLVGARRCRRPIEAEAAGSKHGSILIRRIFSQTGVCGHHRRRAVGVDAAAAAAASRSPAVGGTSMTLDAFLLNAENNDGADNRPCGFSGSGSDTGRFLGGIDDMNARYIHTTRSTSSKSCLTSAGTIQVVSPVPLKSGIGGLQAGPGLPQTFLQPVPGPYHCQSPQSVRQMSSWADILPSVPEFAQHWTVWGGSGILLKTIHHDGAVPYWACMAITNILVRSSLVPLVIQSAHTASRFAKVAPEVQFLLTIFQKDMKGLRERNESPVTQFLVMKATWQTLSALYKVHKIHPFAVFKAPLMQLPVFWYFSIDLRKIINGADPGLAQGLTEGGLLWVTDLTEPDPWYGLPILGGLLLYANVEVALGKKILSGEATSKANVAVTLKDCFQSLAVFMPCFMAHQPAGVQIYLATSFVFTMFQSAALRNDDIRALIGLPRKDAQQKVGTVTKEFVDIKEFEKEAKEARGEGELLGEHGVLQPGWESTISGTSRPSTIVGSAGGSGNGSGNTFSTESGELSGSDPARLRELWSPSLEVSGGSTVSATSSTSAGSGVLRKSSIENTSGQTADDEEKTFLSGVAAIEAANRGEMPQKPVTFVKPDDRSEDKDSPPLKLGKLIKNKKKRKGRKKK